MNCTVAIQSCQVVYRFHPMSVTNCRPVQNSKLPLIRDQLRFLSMACHSPDNVKATTVKMKCEEHQEYGSCPITPVMMPSATKFKRPHLASIMAEKAFVYNVPQNWTPSYLKNTPPTLSNISLPPQPVTMPSFAKGLPGRKQVVKKTNPSPNHLEKGRSCEAPMLLMPQCLPIVSVPPNVYSLDLSSPAYQSANFQLFNMIPPQSNGHLYNIAPTCSGNMLTIPQTPMVSPISQSYHASEHIPANFQLGCVQPINAGVHSPTDLHQFYPPVPPFFAQSMPCFTPPFQATHDITYRKDQSVTSRRTVWTQRAGLRLPPIPEGNEPVYSTSMPEISFGNGDSTPRIQAPVLFRNMKTPRSSFRVEREASKSLDGTTVPSKASKHLLTSSEEDLDGAIITRSHCDKNLPMTMQDQHEVLTLKSLGPESKPEEVPSRPRVVHTPVQTSDNYRSSNTQSNDAKVDQCISTSDFVKYAATRESKQSSKKTMSTADRLKELKSQLTPRKKIKPVVVAVHDCFPSDSSISDKSDVELTRRKNPFNYNVHPTTAMKKRKPRIDTNVKPKITLEGSEVFEDLDVDLNPEEVRVYTSEHISKLLGSPQWDENYEGLQVIVRLARHRPKLLLSYLEGPIVWLTFKHVTSPKSALCRAAIVTFKEMFERIGSALEPDLDKVAEKLVLKSLAPNTFIRDECDRALKAMVTNCSLLKVLTALEYVSAKSHGRAASCKLARMALVIVHVAGIDACLRPNYAEKLLPMLFKFMTEADNGTRMTAKEALGMLMNHLQFEPAVKKFVQFDRNCSEVFKKLDKMRGRSLSRDIKFNKFNPARIHGR